VTVVSNKLDLKSRSVTVYKHGRSDIPGPQTMGGKVCRKRNSVEFLD
jgi:hypothetical protein